MHVYKQCLHTELPPEVGMHDDCDEEADCGNGDTHDGGDTKGQRRAVSLETIINGNDLVY